MRIVKHEPGSIRRGAAAAELAMWLPFLALSFVIALDFCRAYYVTQTVQNCARAGAMYASGNATANPGAAGDPVVQAAIVEGVSLNPPLEAANVTVSSSAGSNQVSVSYNFIPIVSWPGIGSSLTITRSVTMKTIPVPGT